MSRRAVSAYVAVLILVAASIGLAASLYQGFSASFRLAAPPAFGFSYQAVDSGSGYEQVTATFQFQGRITLSALLLNGTSKGYLSLGQDGNYVPARGGTEFFSLVLPAAGTLTVSNVSSAIIDGVLSPSINATKGRHAVIVVASGNYSVTGPSFSASRGSGLDPLPILKPDDVSKPSSFFSFLLPMEPGTSLTVTLLYEGGTAEGFIHA